MTNAIINGSKIEISFDFDTDIISRVRKIDGREWNKPNHPGVWTVPATGWHADQVINLLPEFWIDPAIKFMATGEKVTPKIKLPKELYKFQKEGVKYIASTKGRCIIADDMGLGKSAEALTYVRFFAEGRTLIVSPSNVTFKWKEEECARWFPESSVEVIRSSKDKMPDTDIVIMSYGMLEPFFEELKEIPWENVILDESHYVKNFKAIRSRMAKALIHGGIPHVLLLSGTPFLNNPGELFSQLHLIDKTSFPNFYSYAIRYCGAFKQDGMWMFPKDVVTNREELEKRLERYMIRRTKQEVELELPELTRSYIPIELNKSGEYKKALAKFKDWKKQAKNFTNALTQLTELRQIIGREKVASTIELAEEILEAGRKVVIFAHHREVIDMLEKGLKKYRVGIITGDVKAEERQKIASTFVLDNSKIQVILMTTAGVEGLNMYGAQDILFCEREWTPAKEEQAEARLHRIGQKSNVTSHYFVVKDTVDEKIDKIVRMKRELIGQVISQDTILEIVLESV